MSGFSAVDGTLDPAELIAYLDEADRAPLIVDLRARIADALKLCPGEAVVDVGCGTGTALFELAERVGDDGRAVGVDASAEMVAVAEQRRSSSVEVICASATALPFDEGAFDAYRVERAGRPLHLTPTEFKLAARLVRAGGRVVTHRQLLADVWGAEHVLDTHYLRLYMGQLRAKLEAVPSEPRHLLTETGVGYRLIVD